MKIVYAAGGLTPGVLSLTGFVLWWKRERSARTAGLISERQAASQA